MIMQFTVLNYNIFQGFRKLVPPFEIEQERLAAAQELVAELNPGVVTLTEACYGGPNPRGIVTDYAKLFGYENSAYGSWGNHGWGNVILSRFPVKAKTTLLPAKGTAAQRSALQAILNVDGKELNVDIFHPHPELTEGEKIEMINPLLENKPEFYILTGDFNALSDEDTYDREKLIQGFRRFDKTPEGTVDKMLERKLVPFIRSRGLVDAFPHKNRESTMPTLIYGPHRESAMRIDYFFISPKVKVLEARVIKNELSEKASDHYPIWAKFEI